MKDPDVLNPHPIAYLLSILTIDQPFAMGGDLSAATPVETLVSATPWGAISVGDSIKDRERGEWFGVVSHVEHLVGKSGGDKIRHEIRLYIGPVA